MTGSEQYARLDPSTKGSVAMSETEENGKPGLIERLAEESIRHRASVAMSGIEQNQRAINAAIEIASTVFGDYDDAQGALSDIHMLLAPAGRSEPQGEPSSAQVNHRMVDAVGGVIYSAMQEDRDPYETARGVLAVVGKITRQSCTPTAEAYRVGGDALVYAVADWIGAGVTEQGA